MSIWKFGITLISDVLLVGVVILLSVFLLWGALLPRPTVTSVVGEYQLSTFSTGIAFYVQGNYPHFYDFSPYKDFVVDTEGNRATLATYPDQERTMTQTTTSISLQNWREVTEVVKSYFEPATEISFSLDRGRAVTFIAQPKGNTVQIRKTVEMADYEQIGLYGHVMEYSADDYVFDPVNKASYSSRTAKELESFKQAYNLALSASNGAKIVGESRVVPSGKIVVHNPQLPGFMVIEARGEQQLRINDTWHLVEVTEPIHKEAGKPYQTRFEVSILSSLDQLKGDQ